MVRKVLLALVVVGLLATGSAAQIIAPLKMGAGVKIADLNYITSLTQMKLVGYLPLHLHLSIGGTVWAFSLDAVLFGLGEIKIFDQILCLGTGFGSTLVYLSSPELPPKVASTFYALPIQAKWEGEIGDWSLIKLI